MKKKGFFDFFPPPQFLETPSVGLDISDDAVRFVEFERTHNNLRLKRYGEKALPAGLVESGYVNDEKALGKILGDLQKEFHLKYVRVALPDEKIYLFKTEVPKNISSNMRESVEFKIEDNVPLSVTEAVFDYSVLDRENPNKDYFDIVVSVAPQKVVGAYLSALSFGGLVPLVLEVESRSIAKAIIAKGDSRVFLILNIEKAKTGLYIVSDYAVHFTSVVNLGIDSLANTSQDIVLPTTLKNSIIRPHTPSLILEIQKLYDYWEGHEGKEEESKKIQKIIVCGGTVENAESVELLEPVLKTKVEIANVWRNAFSFDKAVPEIPFSDSLRYATAVGLALPIVAD